MIPANHRPNQVSSVTHPVSRMNSVRLDLLQKCIDARRKQIKLETKAVLRRRIEALLADSGLPCMTCCPAALSATQHSVVAGPPVSFQIHWRKCAHRGSSLGCRSDDRWSIPCRPTATQSLNAQN